MRRDLAATLVLASLTSAPAALAEESPEKDLPRIGMAPGEPLSRSASPSVPVGIDPAGSKDNVLDLHGYLLLPFRMGILQREDPEAGQTRTALHSPPVIPQHLRSFEYVGVVPEAWGQLNITYGNSRIAATAILAAQTFTDADGFYNSTKQLGVNDLFLTVNLSHLLDLPLELKVGATTGRYGAMGTYDSGRYGTPLIARTNAIGETLTAGLELSENLDLVLEHGIGGQLGRPPQGLVPAGWNDFADPNVGASFVSHFHAGLGLYDQLQLGLHYFTAWTQDDQVPDGLIPHGRISVLGADARMTAGRAGHLYLGVAQTDLKEAGSVSGIIEVLNARGGPEMIAEYLGPESNGNGKLTTFGGQYDLSIARAVYADQYTGTSPDITLSAFGVGTKVTSDDTNYDDVMKIKGGAEITYTMASWFGVSTRFDHVRLDADDARNAFTVISPRLLMHTDWQSRDEFALQYSLFIYGSAINPRTGFPPVPDPETNPDRHVISLTGTYWW